MNSRSCLILKLKHFASPLRGTNKDPIRDLADLELSVSNNRLDCGKAISRRLTAVVLARLPVLRPLGISQNTGNSKSRSGVNLDKRSLSVGWSRSGHPDSVPYV